MEHVNDCMMVRNQLIALGETVPDKQFVDKVLYVDWELFYLRPMLACAPIDEIVAGLTDGYSNHYQDRQHQHSSAGRGRFQHGQPRGQGALAAAAGPPAMAAVNAVAAGEERVCCNCYQRGHLRENCPKLHSEVLAYLKRQAAARGRGRGKGRGKGRGGPAVAAISTSDVQHMVDSLPGESSAFLPDQCLVGSGADISICFQYEFFWYVGPSDFDTRTPMSLLGARARMHGGMA